MQPAQRSRFFLKIGGDISPGHNIGHGKAASRLEHAESLAQHTVLVGGEVDDAI